MKHFIRKNFVTDGVENDILVVVDSEVNDVEKAGVGAEDIVEEEDKVNIAEMDVVKIVVGVEDIVVGNMAMGLQEPEPMEEQDNRS